MVDFSDITLGHEYDRPTLARMWGYESFNALGRGVVTPKGSGKIILFITKEKQESLTQYEDHIEQDILFWEGEKEHRSDGRIVEGKDPIHVFYRERHHSSFAYYGLAKVLGYKLFKDQPSKFTFQLIDRRVTIENLVEEVQTSYLSLTEKEAIIKSRRGQGIYRENAIELWKTCSVTGFEKKDILIASHIKPWKISTNFERISPYNSLVLIPTLDRLFDRGYIGFDTSGRIHLSDKIQQVDWTRIGLNVKSRLRTVPSDVKGYLEYHNEYIFDQALTKLM
jgi:putative restriction endonuclease